eukprot:XP_011681442.1 PREDICTED: uncharacterized protein LOC105446387 [Strongylocentrotus purpuratus]
MPRRTFKAWKLEDVEAAVRRVTWGEISLRAASRQCGNDEYNDNNNDMNNDNNVGAMSCLYEPRRLFNCDESGFAIGGRAGTRVLAEKGSKLVHELRNTDKTQMSVLVYLNAAGDIMPPLIIVPAKRTEVCGRYMDGRQHVLPVYRTRDAILYLPANVFYHTIHRFGTSPTITSRVSNTIYLGRAAIIILRSINFGIAVTIVVATIKLDSSSSRPSTSTSHSSSASAMPPFRRSTFIVLSPSATAKPPSGWSTSLGLSSLASAMPPSLQTLLLGVSYASFLAVSVSAVYFIIPLILGNIKASFWTVYVDRSLLLGVSYASFLAVSVSAVYFIIPLIKASFWTVYVDRTLLLGVSYASFLAVSVSAVYFIIPLILGNIKASFWTVYVDRTLLHGVSYASFLAVSVSAVYFIIPLIKASFWTVYVDRTLLLGVSYASFLAVSVSAVYFIIPLILGNIKASFSTVYVDRNLLYGISYASFLAVSVSAVYFIIPLIQTKKEMREEERRWSYNKGKRRERPIDKRSEKGKIEKRRRQDINKKRPEMNKMWWRIFASFAKGNTSKRRNGWDVIFAPDGCISSARMFGS